MVTAKPIICLSWWHGHARWPLNTLIAQQEHTVLHKFTVEMVEHQALGCLFPQNIFFGNSLLKVCRQWGVTEFCSGFPGLFMCLARCLPSSGHMPCPLGFYLVFLLACLLTPAFLSLLQPRIRGCGPCSGIHSLQGSSGQSHHTPWPYTSSHPFCLIFLPYHSENSLKTNSVFQFRAKEAAKALVVGEGWSTAAPTQLWWAPWSALGVW